MFCIALGCSGTLILLYCIVSGACCSCAALGQVQNFDNSATLAAKHEIGDACEALVVAVHVFEFVLPSSVHIFVSAARASCNVRLYIVMYIVDISQKALRQFGRASGIPAST